MQRNHSLVTGAALLSRVFPRQHARCSSSKAKAKSKLQLRTTQPRSIPSTNPASKSVPSRLRISSKNVRESMQQSMQSPTQQPRFGTPMPRLAGGQRRVAESSGSTMIGTAKATRANAAAPNITRIKSLPHAIFPGDSNTIELGNGRGVMGFAKVGFSDPGRTAIPLLKFHGSPSTRLSSWGLHTWGEKYRVPIIAPERPGMGYSSFNGNYTITQHCRDATDLMHTLGYNRYMVYGSSGGGPYALGMSALPTYSEVVVTGVSATSGPIEASTNGNSLMRWWNRLSASFFPRRFKRLALKVHSVQKRRLLKWNNRRPQTPEEMEERSEVEESRGNYVEGITADKRAIGRDWDFAWGDVANKGPVIMYHGILDDKTSIEGARYIRNRMGNNCHLTEVPNGTHDLNVGNLLRRMLKCK